MEKVFLFLLILSTSSLYAQLLESADAIKTAGKLEPVDTLFINQFYKKHDIANNTKDALLSYPSIEARANYLARKLQRITLGEYAETAAYLAPFITGEVSAKILDFNLLLNFNEGNGKIVYSFKF